MLDRIASRRHRHFALPLLVSVWASGCGEGESAVATSTVRDSAGIEIVESPTPQWTAEDAWRLSPAPTHRFGNREGEPPLGSVSDAKLLSDGRAVVADRTSSSLLYYAADEAFQFEAGGPGEGPGEFGAIANIIGFDGDTVAAVDMRGLRTNVYAPDGEFVRDLRIDVGRGAYGPYTVGPDESLILTPHILMMSQTRTAEGWSEEPLLRTDLMMTRVDTVRMYPARYVGIDTDRIQPNLFPAFGIPSSSVHGLVFARTDRAEVEFLNPNGTLRRLARWDHPQIPVSQTLLDELLQERLDGLDDDADPSAIAGATDRFNSSEYPEIVPPVRLVEVDADGNVWLKGWDLPGRTTGRTWQVVSRDGVWLGGVEVPERFTIHEIGTDYMLGVALDDFDVPTVVLYDLVKP